MNDSPNRLREPLGYICPTCREEIPGCYRPFCGECGRAMPSQRRMQVLGLTIYSRTYRRPILALEEIAQVVAEIGRAKHWLDEYEPWGQRATICLHQPEQRGQDYEFVCAGTTRLELPIENGWFGSLTIERLSDGLHCLSDVANDVRVVARSVELHRIVA